MNTATLTLHLPKDALDFAERYAREHHMTLTELIGRQLQRLRLQSELTHAADLADREPGEGLFTLLGRWEDGDEFADEVDRVVASRSGPRPMPDFEA